MERLIVERRAV